MSHPRVRVTGAPGYADFEGIAILFAPADWPVRKVIVEFEHEGHLDHAVVPEHCVRLLESE